VIRPLRISNHVDFAKRYSECLEVWRKHTAAFLVDVRNSVVARRPDATEADWADEYKSLLEAHVRVFVVDGFLRSLQWNMGVEVFPEVGGAITADRRFYIDYLGVSRASNTPIMLVEAKRESVALPGIRRSAIDERQGVLNALVDILGGKEVAGQWGEIIEQLRGYRDQVAAGPVGATLKRVVVTNGDWLIIFINPQKTLTGDVNPADIKVFLDARAVLDASELVFSLLSYSCVSEERNWIKPGHVRAYLGANGTVKAAMFGLTLDYSVGQTTMDPSPHVSVTCTLYLLCDEGRWIGVRDDELRDTIPLREGHQADHLVTMEGHFIALRQRVERQLGLGLNILPVAHDDILADYDLPAVRKANEVKHERYELVLGDRFHYWSLPEQPGPCRFHTWDEANAAMVAIRRPINKPSADPRCFFASGHRCHCPDMDVHTAKSATVGANGPSADPFCKIWRIDEHMCCRSCVYQDLCFGAQHKACDPRARAAALAAI